MHSDLVLPHILRLKGRREGYGAGAHDEEGRLESLFVQVLQQVGGVVPWPIIVSQSPGKGVRALRDILVVLAAGAGPPASIRVAGDGGIIETTTRVRRRMVGYADPRVRNFFLPLLHQSRVSWRRLVKGWVVRRADGGGVG